VGFYAILGVDKKASREELRKAYRRTALRVHPDVNKSESATEEFQYLAKIHETLSNDSKRKFYDKHGEVDDESSVTAEAEAHWRAVFPKFTVADIQSYKKEYIGNSVEQDDVSRAYNRYKGNMNSVMQSVPFADSESLDRIVTIIDVLGLTSKYSSAYKKSMIGLKARLAREEQTEASLAEKAAEEMGLDLGESKASSTESNLGN